MRTQRVNGLIRMVASVGVIFLFWAGVAAWARAQPRVAQSGNTVADHPAGTTHTAHSRYARIGSIHGRAVYGRTTVGHATYVHRAGGRPVHADVTVHVAVQPAYPVAGALYPAGYGWYPPYAYPYGYYLYQADLSAQGYSDGFHRGQDDAEDHRPYDPYRKGYRNPGSATYDAGFLNGYAAGYGR